MANKRIHELDPSLGNILPSDRLAIDRFNPGGGTFSTLHSTGQQLINTIQNVIDNSVTGGLEGTNYIYVPADQDHVNNAVQLQQAYNDAKLLTPNGDAISDTNQVYILVAPGYFDFPSDFILDTPYINIIALSQISSTYHTNIETINFNGIGTLEIATGNVYVSGVNVGNDKPFLINDNYFNIVCVNCTGGDNSFGSIATVNSNITTLSGIFINCNAKNISFGFGINASGTFINCSGGHSCFGSSGNASGYFKNCTGASFCFGGNFNASGTFINCESMGNSFGGHTGIASGLFINCISYSTGSFGGIGGIASGQFYYCLSEGDSFGGGSSGGQASGVFQSCVANSRSFGFGGTITGKLYYCRLISGNFIPPTVNGQIVLCIDGDDDVITQSA